MKMHVNRVANKPSTSGAGPEPGRSSTADKVVDRVLIHGRTEDGRGLKVLRHRDNRLEAGVAQPLREGEALQGEIVRLKPHKDFPLLCDVETQFSLKDLPARGSKTVHAKGPARVSTAAYRKNWSTVWGGTKNPCGIN